MMHFTHTTPNSNSEGNGDLLDIALPGDRTTASKCSASRTGNFDYAILGLVACHADGVHGYRLKHELESICDEFVRLSYGRVYNALEWLAAIGHLEKTDCVQLGRPNRKVYRITSEGDRSLENWLALPIAQDPHPVRDELSLKILFARRGSGPALKFQIEQQRSFILTRLARIARHRKRLAKTSLATTIVDVVLTGPEMRMHADLAWLKQIETKLQME